MKATIAYYSRGGRTKEMAQLIADGMNSVDSVDARIYSIEEIDLDHLAASDVFLIGTPVWYASTTWQVKKWFDESRAISLAGKLGGAFATADYAQGGASNAITMILSHMMVKGMLVYSGGGAYGKPIIHQGPVALKDTIEADREMFPIYGKRMAQKAIELFGE